MSAVANTRPTKAVNVHATSRSSGVRRNSNRRNAREMTAQTRKLTSMTEITLPATAGSAPIRKTEIALLRSKAFLYFKLYPIRPDFPPRHATLSRASSFDCNRPLWRHHGTDQPCASHSMGEWRRNFEDRPDGKTFKRGARHGNVGFGRLLDCRNRLDSRIDTGGHRGDESNRLRASSRSALRPLEPHDRGARQHLWRRHRLRHGELEGDQRRLPRHAPLSRSAAGRFVPVGQPRPADQALGHCRPSSHLSATRPRRTQIRQIRTPDTKEARDIAPSLPLSSRKYLPVGWAALKGRSRRPAGLRPRL